MLIVRKAPLDLTRPANFLLLFGLLFLVTWPEPLQVAGTKFAIIWRAGLLCTALLALLIRPWPVSELTRALTPLSLCYAAYLITPLMAVAFGEATLGAVLEVVAQRSIPLLTAALIIVLGAYLHTDSLLRSLPFYLCIIAVPITIGLLEPTGKVFSLEHLGGARVSAYIGPFQNQHSAALGHAIAALIAWNVFTRSVSDRLWWYLLAAAGCALLTLMTTARAGVGGMILGMVCIAGVRGAWRQMLWVAVAGLAVFAVVLLSNQGLYDLAMNRVLGTTIYQSSGVTLDSFASGRGALQAGALKGYANLDGLNQIFGIGRANTDAVIARHTGLLLMAHSVFIDELLRYGFLGLTALAAMLVAALVCTVRNAIAGQPLGLALVLLVVFFAAFQSLDYSLHVAIIGMVIVMETVARNVSEGTGASAATGQ